MQPQLPVDVDPQTGVWTTDALPMLYVPRHFFTNNHVAVEEALGREAYADILCKAGYSGMASSHLRWMNANDLHQSAWQYEHSLIHE